MRSAGNRRNAQSASALAIIASKSYIIKLSSNQKAAVRETQIVALAERLEFREASDRESNNIMRNWHGPGDSAPRESPLDPAVGGG